jgi:transposase
MAIFRQIDRNSGYLLPLSVDELLPENHLARFIVEVVESLDLSAFERSYVAGGSKAYHPEILLALFIYGYVTGIFSSRKIETATYDSLAFRFIAAGDHPNHRTLANFRRQFINELKPLFNQVLEIAYEMKMLKLGTVSLDGTKIHANASRHSALSYGHIVKLEAQFEAEISHLFEMAEAADQSTIPDGMNLPQEIALRKTRLSAMKLAKTKIEARVEIRDLEAQLAYEAKLEKRANHLKETGKKPGGKSPKAPIKGPQDKDQINLTDEESRIMHVSGGGFEQSYNAQATVDVDSYLIMTTSVTQDGNDRRQIETALAEIAALPDLIGKPENILADTGYFSAENVSACESAGIEAYIAVARDAHHPSPEARFSEPSELPNNATPVQKMTHKLKTKTGRGLYALRKQTVEPVFGCIKSAMGFRQFSLRGIEKVKGEWDLVCLAWNLKRMAKLRPNYAQSGWK